MKKVKAIIYLLLLSMLIGACGGSPGSTGTADTTGGNTANPDDTGQEPGDDDQEVVNLTVELFDRSNTPADQGAVDDNRWTQYIQEEMLKRNVNVSFHTVPRGEEITLLNVLMASHTAPDISFTYDRNTFLKYANDGGLSDLGPAINEHGENILNRTENDIMQYGVINDTQYGIPANRATTFGVSPHYITFIRQDWLDELNLDTPTNRDELVDVLRAFRDEDPGEKGLSLIPWAIETYGFGSEPTEHKLYDAAYSFLNNSNEEDITTPIYLREGFKEYMEWMNQLYDEGLIDPNFAVGTSVSQEVQNGNVGLFSEGWWVPYDGRASWHAALTEIEPDAKLVPIEVWQNDEGEYPKTAYLPIGFYVFSPRSNDNAEAAVKYMDFMSEWDVGMMLHFGIEGEHYEMVDGAPEVLDADYLNETLSYVGGDLSLGFHGGMPFENDIRLQLFEASYSPYGELAVDAITKSANQARPYVVFEQVLEAQQTYITEIITVSDEYWAKLIMSDNFEADWTAFMDALEARGINEIADERQAYYDNRN